MKSLLMSVTIVIDIFICVTRGAGSLSRTGPLPQALSILVSCATPPFPHSLSARRRATGSRALLHNRARASLSAISVQTAGRLLENQHSCTASSSILEARERLSTRIVITLDLGTRHESRSAFNTSSALVWCETRELSTRVSPPITFELFVA